MTNHPGTIDYTTWDYKPLVVRELEAIFDTLSDEGLLKALIGPKRRSPSRLALEHPFVG